MSRGLSRAWKDWSGRSWLPRGVITAGFGLAIGLATARLLEWLKVTAHYPAWVPGLIGAIGALVFWGGITFIVALLRAPWKLLAETEEENNQLRRQIEGDQRDIDKRLKLIHERLFPHRELSIKTGELLPEQDQQAKFRLYVILETKTELRNVKLTLKCSAPIYDTATRNLSDTSNVRAVVIPKPRPHILFNRATVSFGSAQLPAGSLLGVLVYSLTATSLVSVFIDDGKG